MALINNPNSWNGGSAVFDATPITETYLKLAAHREAKNQALDQYHQKQLERVDRDGVRDQDAETFQKKVNDWNEHWQANKDPIRKGNIRAQIDNDKLYGDLLGFVKESKTRSELDKAAMPVGLSLKNKMGTTPDQFHADIQANSLPIGAPGSKKIDLNPYVNEPDDWDVEKGMKAYDRIPRVPAPPIVGATDPKTGKRLITEVEGFDDKAKANIAAMAGSEFQNDRSFNKAVQTAVANPQSKQMLTQLYKDEFGKEPEHPEEYATAFAMSKMPIKQTQKLEDDKDWVDKQKEARDYQRQMDLKKFTPQIEIDRLNEQKRHNKVAEEQAASRLNFDQDKAKKANVPVQTATEAKEYATGLFGKLKSLSDENGIIDNDKLKQLTGDELKYLGTSSTENNKFTLTPLEIGDFKLKVNDNGTIQVVEDKNHWFSPNEKNLPTGATIDVKNIALNKLGDVLVTSTGKESANYEALKDLYKNEDAKSQAKPETKSKRKDSLGLFK